MEPDGSSAKIILRGLKLAHVFLLFINAELYVRFGLKLRKLCKEKFPGRELVVITHTGQGVGDIIDNESADHQVIQAYGRLIPGAADDRFYAVAEKIMEALEKGMDVWN